LVLGENAIHYDPEYPYNWQNSTVKNIILNRVNIGEMVAHKSQSKSFKNQKLVRLPKDEWITVEGTHEPIVSHELFDRAVRIVSIKKRRNTVNANNVFQGLLFCNACGSALGFMVSANRTELAWHYVCSRYRHSGKLRDTHRTCTMHYTPHKSLFPAVLSRLQSIINANLTVDNILARLPDRQTTSDNSQKQLELLKRRDSELMLLIKRIVEREAFGEISSEIFSKLYSDYVNERGEITRKIELLEAELNADNRDRENAERFLEMVKKHTSPTELTREILLDFIDKIIVHEATGDWRKGTREQTLEVYYRYIGKIQD
jgi:hypothetical protein